jgi:DNA adenine methylase
MPTTPLKWFGGKHYLATKLDELAHEHIPNYPDVHYVEPYFGGGSFLLQKTPGGSEVVNDINSRLINFWKVLAHQPSFESLQRRLEATPFSQELWAKADEYTGDSIEDAANFFIRCRQSRAGQFKDFAPLSRNRRRRGMNEQASAWLTAVEGLPAVHNRLKRVVVLNQPALEVIRREDGPQTFFYLDPPYLPETRISKEVYAHEMSYEDHEALLDVVTGTEGRVFLSGYRSKLYDRKLRDWLRVDFDLPNNASKKRAKDRVTESVWVRV